MLSVQTPVPWRPSYSQGFARSAEESACPNLWDGLIGVWPTSLGPTGDKVYDWSGFNRHGSLTSMDPLTDWVIGGNPLSPGHVLDYDGSDDRVVLPTTLMAGFTAWTLGAWIKPEGALADNLSCFLGGLGATTFPALRQVGTSGILECYAASTTSSALINSTRHTTAMVIGEWMHVIFGYEPDANWFYVNGVDEATKGPNQAGVRPLNANDPNGVRIGAGQNASAKAWNGQIGDFAIWNRALTQNEVQQLYNIPHALLQPRQRTIIGSPGAPPVVGNPMLVNGGLVDRGLVDSGLVA